MGEHAHTQLSKKKLQTVRKELLGRIMPIPPRAHLFLVHAPSFFDTGSHIAQAAQGDPDSLASTSLVAGTTTQGSHVLSPSPSLNTHGCSLSDHLLKV